MSDRSAAIEMRLGGESVVSWWHWIIGFGMALFLTFLIPRGQSPEFAHLTKGSISNTKIIAPFDFEVIKTSDELKQERDAAAETVLPVVVRVDSVSESRIRELMRFAMESHRMLSALPMQNVAALMDTSSSSVMQDDTLFTRGRDQLSEKFGFELDDDMWRYLLMLFDRDRNDAPGLYFRFFEQSLVTILLDLYLNGIVDQSKEYLSHSSGNVAVMDNGEEVIIPLEHLSTVGEALERLPGLSAGHFRDNDYPIGADSVCTEILQRFVVANVFFDSVETARRRQTAIAKVALVKGFVKKDELIIDRNIKVTDDEFDKLTSLAIKRAELRSEKGGVHALLPVVGNFVLILLIILLLGLFIALKKPDVWKDWKLIVLIVLVLAMVHLFQALVPVRYGLSRYMLPVAVGAMLLAILVEHGVAMVGVGIMALIAGILRGEDFPTVFNTAMVGGTAILAVRTVRTRGDVMRSGFYLGAIYILLVLAFHFARYTTDQSIWNDLAVAMANAILSPMLVVGLVFIFENLFKITTDLSLLELVDLNRPILRDLAVNAPGTYHHSIMVGGLAETAAQAIGANALLTRAGAYYHDIGKMKHREYFIENQESGNNPHDALPPSRSVKILRSHVIDGLELADQHGLPQQIKDFIAEHHGRTVMSFFYAKALRERSEPVEPDGLDHPVDETVDKDDFRYPGPNPQSKETGILMLADVVEAAVRSMDSSAPEDLSGKVAELIRLRVQEGDLDDTPLTLWEINQIRDAFIQVLSGMYHKRISYPEDKTEESKPELNNIEQQREPDRPSEPDHPASEESESVL